MHGIVMVFFFLIPSIPAVLGNFLIPLMIGARDLAFPRLNLAELVHLHRSAALFTLYAIVNGGVDTGWTFYTPYSTSFSNTQVLAAGLGVFITGFSSILTGLNFIVTIHKMRAPGPHLVPAAAVRVGALRDQPDHGPGHAGDRGDGPDGGPGARRCTWGSSTPRWAATRCCSSTCSGSTRTPRSTS